MGEAGVLKHSFKICSMAGTAETLGLGYRVVDEVALFDREPVPGVHLDGEDFDQGFN